MLAQAGCGSTSKSTPHARTAAAIAATARPATTPAVTFKTISTPTPPAPTVAGDPTATDPTPTPVVGSSPPASLPGGDVALVGATPITLTIFHHWERIAAIGQAQGQKGKPVIIPDYPTFTHCIAQARTITGLRHLPASTLRADCKQLFRSLMTSVMDYLVKALWYELAAAQAGISPTPAQVQQSFEHAKAQQFHSATAYRRFLARTGQTMADVLFRVRSNLDVVALEKRYGGPSKGGVQAQTLRQAKVDQLVRQRYLSLTLCATGYVILDCSNFTSG